MVGSRFTKPELFGFCVNHSRGTWACTCSRAALTAIWVHDVMDLSPPHQGNSGKGSVFSRDVLRLEICGPSQEHLSVIDVPGIFKNATPGVTTKADISLVRSLVLGYMENLRSVMLTVIPANVDVATREILQFAADVDPDRKRTLGVLTKPDWWIEVLNHELLTCSKAGLMH
jgi:hypothetical protein